MPQPQHTILFQSHIINFYKALPDKPFQGEALHDTCIDPKCYNRVSAVDSGKIKFGSFSILYMDGVFFYVL